MNEENKCIGLNCAFCANAKCPNEEKEIIIDGIDVSKCEQFKMSDKLIGLCATGGFCEICPDCHFKQLKRLQQENEELKEKLQWVRTCIDNYLNEDMIEEIDPKYYKEWMLNVRKKVLDKIDKDV